MANDDSGAVTSVEAGQVLVQMHQLLWRASTDAHDRARQTRELADLDLAFNLSHAQALTYDLVPTKHRHAVLDRPGQATVDPAGLAREAAKLARSAKPQHFPVELEAVSRLLDDTLRDFS